MADFKNPQHRARIQFLSAFIWNITKHADPCPHLPHAIWRFSPRRPSAPCCSRTSRHPAQLDDTVIVGKRSDLLGTGAASQSSASGAELRSRPVLRRGEVLEAVPGMVVTQHAGGGKANQYFLRGFNLDHGTDFAISI